MSAILIDNVSKQYGSTVALQQVSFSVQPGELFGLIGPDGAGKSTLFRVLTTLLLPDAGQGHVAGYHVVKDYRKIRKIVGYMPGRFSLYQDLSIEENLTFFATIFGTTVAENYDLIRDIYQQIEPFRKRLAGKLSGGMKQKLALCCALIHRPQILLLDEPTTGVDAVSRKEFWEMLQRLKARGITVLVSTPYMDEASLCDRIALIRQGKILAVDTPKNMVQKYPGPLYAVKANNFYALLTSLRGQAYTQSVLPFGEYLHLATTADLSVADIRQSLAQHPAGFDALEIHPIQPNIEDVFLALSATHAS